MLDKGADCEARAEPDGESPLVKAARYGHAECVAALLKAGAAPDAAGRDGTALTHAAAAGALQAVEALLAAGANPGLADDAGNTPLGLATRHGHIRCVHRLAVAGTFAAPAPAPAAAGGSLVDRVIYRLSFPFTASAPPPPPSSIVMDEDGAPVPPAPPGMPFGCTG